jgi:hypothetical protein
MLGTYRFNDVPLGHQGVLRGNQGRVPLLAAIAALLNATQIEG